MYRGLEEHAMDNAMRGWTGLDPATQTKKRLTLSRKPQRDYREARHNTHQHAMLFQYRKNTLLFDGWDFELFKDTH